MEIFTVADIETIPNIDAVDFLDEPTADKRFTDPLKIAADIAKKKAKATGDMGLNPNFGRIAAICYAEWQYVECEEEGVVERKLATSNHHMEEATDEQERAVLIGFWEKVVRGGRLVTFNGIGFDIPFILRRSWLLDVRPTVTFDTSPYKCASGEGNHVDVMAVLNQGDMKRRGGLDLYARLKLGKSKTEGMDGAQVWPAWQEGRIKDICNYGEDDCIITLELFESLYGFYIR